MTSDSQFAESMMHRALELARNGLGAVEPNPAVGAVIVDESGQIIGEGWHQKYGGPHAEVHALAAAGNAARGATLYVTLEPCCHYGKTPPCSKSVIEAGIRKVIVAMSDPAPHVDGGGIRELRNAGIEVEIGLLERDAKRLVAPFLQLITTKRPWFHAKWAMTLDGKIASRNGHSQWISNEASREIVHRLRGRMDAILVGIGTALSDDPKLTARPEGPRVATRIVLDSQARLPITSKLVTSLDHAPVLVVAAANAPVERCNELRRAGVEVLQIEPDGTGRPDVKLMAKELGRRRMTNVLIEGGSDLFGSFFDAELIDEVHAFISTKIVGGSAARSPVSGCGLDCIPVASSLDQPVIEVLDGDLYIHGLVARK